MFLRFAELAEPIERALELIQSGNATMPVVRPHASGAIEDLTDKQAAWFVAASLLDDGGRAAITSTELSRASHRDSAGTPVELALFLAGLSRYEPDLTASLLMEACAQEASNRNPQATTPDELTAWYEGVRHWCDPCSPKLAPQLHGAAARAVAGELASRWLRNEPDWRDEDRTLVLTSLGLTEDNATVDLISLLALLDHLEHRGAYSTDDITSAERRYWEERIDAYLEAPFAPTIAEVAGWLLAWRSDSASRFLAVAAVDHEVVLRAVENVARSTATGDRLSRIARGLVALVRNGEESRLDAGSSWLRDRRHFGRPQSMRAPSGTWLGSADLETLLRYRVDTAAERWRWEGGTQEEHFTGALMEQLSEQLTDLRGARGPRGGVTLRAKLTRKTDERTSGADLGLVVDVNLAQEVRVIKGHLVQVKRSDGGDPSRWTIDIKQLFGILERDETATYWLLSEHPGRRAVCVPASYLLALFRAKNPRKRTGRYRVNFAQVASASVPLGDVLCDLLLGLWLGSRAPATIKTARGDDSDYRPAYQLRISVTGD